MIAIIDYGVGNLFSLKCSLNALGLDSVVTAEPHDLARASHILLPGVGAFGDAIGKLRESGMAEPLLSEAAAGKPVLGICLGMQLLFEKSVEYGEHEGLGLIPGVIRPFSEGFGGLGANLKIPHMGWNSLHIERPDCPLLNYSREGDYVYFVHSYYARDCSESVAASAEYGVTVPAVVWRGNVLGAQFHPEKSGDAGLRMLRAFAEI